MKRKFCCSIDSSTPNTYPVENCSKKRKFEHYLNLHNSPKRNSTSTMCDVINSNVVSKWDYTNAYHLRHLDYLRQVYLKQNVNFDYITVSVKNLNGKVITVSLRKHDTIHCLKERISEKSGCCVSKQRLVFKGRNLPDHNLLEQCGITNGSTLHLVLALCGGGSQFL